MPTTPTPNDISGIDTSPIDQLLKIKEQQEELEGLVARAETTKEKVSEAVFKRVKKDYEGRLAALEADAKPRRKKAREELGRLQPIHDRLKKAEDDARLDKEELEFRHEVGEIKDAVFEEKHKAAQEVLEQREKDFKEADELKGRFLSVKGPEPEPEPPPPPPPPPPRPAASIAPPTDEELLKEITEPSRPTPSLAAMRAAAGEDEPEVVEVEDSTFVPQHLDLPTPAPMAGRSAASGREAPESSTMVMRFARLVSEGDEPPGEFQLGPRTSIGRTQDNEICIANPAVSRKHAVITYADGAYVIADLKSGNGTYVNEERIDQHELQNGDRIRIGPASLVFEGS